MTAARREAATSPHTHPLYDDPSLRYVRDESTALLAICHSFGILARWSGFARAELRPRAKGGKSAGVVTNVLTPGAHAHPWFRGLWDEVGGDRIQVLDSRLYDLVPTGSNGDRKSVV